MVYFTSVLQMVLLSSQAKYLSIVMVQCKAYMHFKNIHKLANLIIFSEGVYAYMNVTVKL